MGERVGLLTRGYAVGYDMSPAPRAEFISELPTQDTRLLRELVSQ
jgi:hypothetical protein